MARSLHASSVITGAVLMAVGACAGPQASRPPTALPTDAAQSVNVATPTPSATPRAGTALPGESILAPTATPEATLTSAPSFPPVSGTIDVWYFPQGADESYAEYERVFEAQNPGADVAYREIPEDDPYFQAINTALQVPRPPDVAIMEDVAWMQAGLVVDLYPHLQSWGVSLPDFNPGGLARGTQDGDPTTPPIYGIGDFLGGNILVYNKAMFDAAALTYPAADQSMTVLEYAEVCRALAQPNPDPAQTIYGCSMPDWAPSIQDRDVFGPDGRTVIGNLNSPEMAAAYNAAAALIRDGVAPSSDVLEAETESALFAAGRMGITWTDFTETPGYQEAGIDFGLAPLLVLRDGDSFVDTWTAPFGTFTDSQNKDGALAFLRFIATDAQRIRMQTSPDPPLNFRLAEEAGYGTGDELKAQYLEVLRNAKPQIFVPPGIDAWNPEELIRLMTVEGQTDAQPILDQMAADAQAEADRAWRDWEQLGQ